MVIKKGQTRPAGAKTIFLPNRYEKNRAHLAVYNWDTAEKVRVETGNFLKNGESFRLMNPHDLFGSTIFEGRCDGNSIEVPVKSEFTVFVVLKNG